MVTIINDFPLISIIVPVYNARDKLIKCISSIQKQTYPNIEIILVDDGSKDGSSDLCDQLAKQDIRVRVFHKENGGQASARNYGIKQSKGEFVGFVDNDDIIEPNMYEVLYHDIVNNNCDVSAVVSDWIYSDRICEPFRNEKSGFYDSNTLIKNMLSKKGIISSSVWDKLFRRELFEKVSFPNGCEYEDYWVMYNILKLVHGIYINVKPLYHWYQYNTSQSKRGFHEKSETYITISEKIYDDIIRVNNDKELEISALIFMLISYIKYFGKLFQSDELIRQSESIHYYQKKLRKIIKKSIGIWRISIFIKLKALILSTHLIYLYSIIWKIKNKY